MLSIEFASRHIMDILEEANLGVTSSCNPPFERQFAFEVIQHRRLILFSIVSRRLPVV